MDHGVARSKLINNRNKRGRERLPFEAAIMIPHSGSARPQLRDAMWILSQLNTFALDDVR
jgi:hypothetical protein